MVGVSSHSSVVSGERLWSTVLCCAMNRLTRSNLAVRRKNGGTGGFYPPLMTCSSMDR